MYASASAKLEMIAVEEENTEKERMMRLRLQPRKHIVELQLIGANA
jgi:hypothetical protein